MMRNSPLPLVVKVPDPFRPVLEQLAANNNTTVTEYVTAFVTGHLMGKVSHIADRDRNGTKALCSTDQKRVNTGQLITVNDMGETHPSFRCPDCLKVHGERTINLLDGGTHTAPQQGN